MKKCISLIIVILIVISCLPFTASAANSGYNRLQYILNTPDLPQFIRCSIRLDPQIVHIADSFSGFEPTGFFLPLASADYDHMYDADYTVKDDSIVFEYTLNPGFDKEDLFDCLDKLSVMNNGGIIDRSDDVKRQLTLFDGAFYFEKTYQPYCAVTDLINTDGTVVYKDGKRLAYSAAASPKWTVLASAGSYVLNSDKYEDLFKTQYNYLTYDSINKYRAFYEHFDSNGAVDWALVNVKVRQNPGAPEYSDYYEFGNRVLSTENKGNPFTFDIGIYDAKKGRFFDLKACTAEDYDGMEAVWTELGSGRLLGDMDGDNELTVSDVTLIQRCQAELIPYPEDDRNLYADSVENAVAFYSDFDQDGERGITDATMIQRFLVDMPHRTAEYEPYAVPSEPFHPTSDPSIPSITGFRSLGKGIEISIGTVPGAEKYRLYFKNKNGNWEKMGETAGEPFISTNNIDVGTTYYYTVRCIKADLSSFTSDFDRTGWGHTYAPNLDAPHIKRIEAVENGVKITWDPVDGAYKYRVLYKSGNSWLKLADTDSTSYVYTDIDDGQYINYSVRCLSQKGDNYASGFDHVGTPFSLRIPPVPKNLRTTQSGIAFELGSSDADMDVAVYRKNGSSWKRIGQAPANSSFTDTDVVPGKSYTYNFRYLSSDGTYFVSRYNSTGFTQSFTVDKCIPELEYIINYGDGYVNMQAKEECKFDIPKYAVMIYSGSEYIGACLLKHGEPGYFQDDFFKTHQSFTVYVVGLDKNEEAITSYAEDGLNVKLLEAGDNLRVKYLGERRYRIRWDKSPSTDVKYYAIAVFEGDDETAVFSDNVPYLYYDVDLSDYPEDAEWTALVWATTEDMISASAPIFLTFKESDYNSGTE